MDNKELRHLSRKDLLELLIEQTKKATSLQEKVDLLEAELNEKRIMIATSGTMAEAALKLSSIFSDADKAAALYLDNIRVNEAERGKALKEAQNEAEKILEEAEKTKLQKLNEANQYMEKVKRAINRFLAENPEIKIKIKD